MSTYKTPDELRAWSRSFNNKSKIIKRGHYDYIDSTEETATTKEDVLNSSSDTINIDNPEDLALHVLENNSSIKSSAVEELFNLGSDELEKINSKYPTTEEQLNQAKKI